VARPYEARLITQLSAIRNFPYHFTSRASVNQHEMEMSLQNIIEDFNAASARLDALEATVPLERWTERRDPNRWSVAECVQHLNISSELFRDTVADGLERARQLGGSSDRLRRDLMGWMLWKSLGPPVKMKVKAPATHIPDGRSDPKRVIDLFRRLQVEQIEWVRQAEGLPIDKVKVVSPFSSKVRYNMYSCLSTLPRHQHRHLWQAEQVWSDK
jgi:hypothetical protein